MSDETQERIDGRKWAEEVLEEVYKHSDAFQLGFLRYMKNQFGGKEVRVVGPRPFSDAKAREFGHHVIPFGKHAGSRYDEVPLDYLEWLVDQNTELARYLMSRRIKDEKEMEG